MDTLEQLLYDYITNPDWSALAKGDRNAMPRIIVAEGPILSALTMRMYMASPTTAAVNIVHALRECLTLLADKEAQRLGGQAVDERKSENM